MDPLKVSDVVRTYGLKEIAALSALEEDINRLVKTLNAAKDEKETSLIIQHFRNEEKNNYRLISKLEKAMDRAIRSLEDMMALREKGGVEREDLLKKLQAGIEEYRRLFVRSLSRGGELQDKLFGRKLFGHYFVAWRVTKNDSWIKTAEYIRNLTDKLNDFLAILQKLSTLKKLQPPTDQIIEGVKIPDGFTLLSDWKKQNPNKEPETKYLRYFQYKYIFVHDPCNEKFNSFLAKCKADTKRLRPALQTSWGDQEPRIYFKGRLKTKAYNLNVKFTISPPLFTTSLKYQPRLEDEDAARKTRFQFGEMTDDFILHIDENHRLSSVRFMEIEYRHLRFKEAVKKKITDRRNDIQKSYGDWDECAKLITDAVASAYSWCMMYDKPFVNPLN